MRDAGIGSPDPRGGPQYCEGPFRAAAALGGLLALLCVGLPAPASALAWVPEGGGVYAKVSGRWLPGLGYHRGPEEADGALFTGTTPFGAYHEVFVTAYGEVGVGRGLAVWVHSQGLRVFLLGDPRDDSLSTHVSAGEPAVGLRGQLVRVEGVAVSADGWLRVPTGRGRPVQTVYGTDEGHPAIGELIIDAGAWEVGASIALGTSFGKHWLVATIGLTARTHRFDSLLDWSLKLGRPLGKGWGLNVRLAGHHPLGDGAAPYMRSPSGIGNGARYLGLTLEVDKRFTNGFGFGASFAGGFYTSVRQTSGPVVTLFVSYARQPDPGADPPPGSVGDGAATAW